MMRSTPVCSGAIAMVSGAGRLYEGRVKTKEPFRVSLGEVRRQACRPLLLLMLMLASMAAVSCLRSSNPVAVVYVSVDQQLAEPILAIFERDTGIEVRAVYDVEATKTVGLVERLRAEAEAPVADVFWNSEVVRTVVLARAGVLARLKPSDLPSAYRGEGDLWAGQALRARVVAFPEHASAETPRSLAGVADQGSKAAIAYPLFGTTSTHVSALWQVWGAERTKMWLRRIHDSGVQIVDGNSTARDYVLSRKADLALTDTDDVAVSRTRDEAIEMAWADADGSGTLLIPSTVALVKGGPNPETAQRLVEFLLSEKVERMLGEGPGRFMPIRPDSPWPEGLPPRATLTPMVVDYEAMVDVLDEAMLFCRDLFLR